ncbi:uncharacterized protein [Aegilops tauschii subsp. strangulata]|uniref:uncharacterized protein isoform X3 n=1 Tax=Aegilops tauschii subsp. strangulata TaxID=200361 RepID=UPI001ABCC6DA|nr:uncharacterized protein LOC109765559 isoform X3 [Aegilops tauschii subsp. strangulata]
MLFESHESDLQKLFTLTSQIKDQNKDTGSNDCKNNINVGSVPQGPVVLEEASFYYKAPVNKNFSKKVCCSYAPSLPSSKRSRSSDKSNTARQRVWPSLRYTHSYLPSPALRPTLPNLTKLCYTYIMRERSRCVHRNTQANQMTRCLEQANHSQLHSLVLCCIKAV